MGSEVGHKTFWDLKVEKGWKPLGWTMIISIQSEVKILINIFQTLLFWNYGTVSSQVHLSIILNYPTMRSAGRKCIAGQTKKMRRKFPPLSEQTNCVEIYWIYLTKIIPTGLFLKGNIWMFWLRSYVNLKGSWKMGEPTLLWILVLQRRLVNLQRCEWTWKRDSVDPHIKSLTFNQLLSTEAKTELLMRCHTGNTFFWISFFCRSKKY